MIPALPMDAKGLLAPAHSLAKLLEPGKDSYQFNQRALQTDTAEMVFRGTDMVIRKDLREIRYGDKTIKMQYPAVWREGVVFVPVVSFIRDVLQWPVELEKDGKRQLVRVTSLP